MYFDIHSHILPAVDDGAKSLDETLELIKISQNGGIGAIMATPHFYPNEVYFDEFLQLTSTGFNELQGLLKGKGMPEVYLGCEILYFRGLGICEELDKLTLNGSRYLLIELTTLDIKEHFFEDIISLKERGYIPIIAHIERYKHFAGFKRLLQFVNENGIAVQINAPSVLEFKYKGVIKKILKSEIFCVIASDTHSVEHRPPMIVEALVRIGDAFGEEYREKIIENSQYLYKKIVGDNVEKPQT